MKKRPNAGKRTGDTIWLHFFAALLSGAFVFGVLFCVFAALLCRVDVPVSYLPLLSMLAACAAVFCAGMVFGRMHTANGLAFGALFGLLCFCILWALAAFTGSTVLAGTAAAKAGAIICGGALGGLTGVMRAEKQRGPKRRKRTQPQ